MDFLTDNNPSNLAIFENTESFQKIAKKASKSAADLNNLSWKAFADPTNRQYPINTKANTLMSYAYFKSANQKDLFIEQNINKAVQIFKLENEIKDIDAKLASLNQENFNEDDYGLVTEDENGIKTGFYLIDTADNVEKSAEYLYEDKNKMPSLEYRTACFQITKKAKELNILNRIPKTIKEVGAEREPNLTLLKYGLFKRAKVLKNVDLIESEMYKEIYNLIKKSHDENDETALIYYFDAITELDRKNGFDKYAKIYLNPYEMYYSGDSLEENRQLAKKIVTIDLDNKEACLIPFEDFTENLEKIANSVYEKEQREKVLQLNTAKTAENITLALKSWKDEDKTKLISNIYQFSDHE